MMLTVTVAGTLLLDLWLWTVKVLHILVDALRAVKGLAHGGWATLAVGLHVRGFASLVESGATVRHITSGLTLAPLKRQR